MKLNGSLSLIDCLNYDYDCHRIIRVGYNYLSDGDEEKMNEHFKQSE